jgi:hypothetical protein
MLCASLLFDAQCHLKKLLMLPAALVPHGGGVLFVSSHGAPEIYATHAIGAAHGFAVVYFAQQQP